MKALTLGFFLATWLSSSIAAPTLKPFDTQSLDEILQHRQGQAFVLMLWSIDCPPCIQELAQIQQLRQQFSSNSLVLVSTDDIGHADEIQRLLTQHQLEHMDNWVFANPMPERLRYRIDPAWYGELPRSYFYQASHQRQPHSGRLTNEMLKGWLDNHPR